eukprot:TRINITY_DN12968_c0_g1_i1.p1 TRINITY_DN12968_c0_g1~~TRINITY_DN12968_c0_g1_i1.p1  ORF type:complete len:311 (-),score=33.32 TRINITY_DN12968_c0_g1_i1:1-888(-)
MKEDYNLDYGYTFLKARLIALDFTDSPYFRCWFALWFICVLFAFFAIITLGPIARPTVNRYLEDHDFLYYPDFILRYVGTESKIQSVACFFNESLLLNSTRCPGQNNDSSCVQVLASNFFTSSSLLRYERIKCTVLVSQPLGPENNMIKWEIVGQSDQSIDPSSIYIRPNDDAWILLTKSVYWSKNGASQDLYDKKLVYHTTLYRFSTFNLTIFFDTYKVWNYVEKSYPGWSSIAQIGGFWFFLVVMHSLAMVGVGCIFPNMSGFLRGESVKEARKINASAFTVTAGEKASILPK